MIITLESAKYGNNEQVRLVPCIYGNGQNCLRVLAMDGMPFMTASVALVEERLQPDEVFIKNYSENEGIEQDLINNGVIEPTPIETVNLKFVKINKFKYTQGFINAYLPAR
jgi:hypothetical protein